MGLNNFIELYQTIGNIYNKVQLDAKKIATRLAREEKQITEKAIQTSVNIIKSSCVKINCFKDEIAKAIWQDYISAHQLYYLLFLILEFQKSFPQIDLVVYLPPIYNNILLSYFSYSPHCLL